MLVPLVGAVGVMGLAMAEGALATSFGVSGSSFKVSASEIEIEEASSFPSTLSSLDGDTHPVLLAAVEEGSASDVCVSLEQDLPVVDKVSLLVRSGSEEPISGTNLVVNAEALVSEGGTINGVEAGRDASTLSTVSGPEGTFGVHASSGTVNEVESTAWAANGGTMTLSGLDVEFSSDGDSCF
ncbi:cholesterol esterase [Halostreptopolyspora alba]|uniref:Cholesterol esterase n=2 Tax=Halostreptopolyspora alba TaxID=2487137 RepID=A0A3N0E353_9ACTN|nr:cholesterol esterase [Nocardiopsaceae bacterium YIM 96095]